MLLLILAGAILRLYNLAGESLWNDELASRYRSSFPTIEEVVTRGVAPDIHPPGYQILMYYVQRLTGDSAFSLRLPSALAGILTIPLLFLLGKKLLDPAGGLLAASLLAFSPVHVALSQEARPYSILIFLSALSVFLLYELCLRVNRGKPLKRITAGLYISTIILLEYLHYAGLLMAVLQLSFLVSFSLWRRKSRIEVTAISFVSILAFLPWGPWAAAQAGTGSYIFSPSLKTVLLVFFEYMSNSKLLFVIFVSFVAASSRSLLKSRDKANYSTSGIYTILMWLFLPITLFFVVSVLFVPVFTSRSLMVSLPAAFLLLAASIRILFPAGPLRLYSSVGICCYLLFSLLFIHRHYSEPHREQFREAATYVADHIEDDSRTLIAASAWNIDYFNYYFEKLPGDIEVDLRAVNLSDYPELARTISLRSSNEVWLLWGHLEPERELIESISRLYDKTDYTSLLHAGVWHFHN